MDFAAGNLAAAEKAINHVLAINPFHAGALNLLANLYFREGMTARALEKIKRAIEIAPDNGTYYCTLAEIAVEDKNIELAIASYQKAEQDQATRDHARRQLRLLNRE